MRDTKYQKGLNHGSKDKNHMLRIFWVTLMMKICVALDQYLLRT